MSEVKTVYTDNIVEALVSAYQNCNGGYEAEQVVVNEWAERLGVKPASVRSKLVREGIYNAKTNTATSRRVRKAELITQLASLMEVDEETVGSFEKATRKALEVVVGRFRAIKEAQ